MDLKDINPRLTRERKKVEWKISDKKVQVMMKIANLRRGIELVQ